MKTLRTAAVAAAIIVLFSVAAQAELLNGGAGLTLTYPIVTADFLTASYDANGFGANGKLTVTAYVDNWAPTKSNSMPLNPLGAYTAVFEIDPATGAGISATLLVTGDINPDDGTLETLFSSSTLLEFGFGIEDKFEAIFRQDVTTAMASEGAEISMVIEAAPITLFNAPTLPFFTADFANDGLGKVDMSSSEIPEPATLTLLAAGAGIFGYFRRLKR